jgi:hypothetical protein
MQAVGKERCVLSLWKPHIWNGRIILIFNMQTAGYWEREMHADILETTYMVWIGSRIIPQGSTYFGVPDINTYHYISKVTGLYFQHEMETIITNP